MPIHPWEYIWTYRLLKTAQQFVPVPGVPALPEDSSKWPRGNPAWDAQLLQDMAQVLYGDIPRTTHIVESALESVSPPGALPKNFSQQLRDALEKRRDDLNLDMVPVYVAAPKGSLLNPGALQQSVDEAYKFVQSWQDKQGRRRLYPYPDSAQLEFLTRLANPTIGAFTYSAPELLSSSKASPSAVVVVRDPSSDFSQYLAHEYGHVLVPAIRYNPNIPPTDLPTEAVAMAAVSAALPGLARELSQGDSPVAARVAGARYKLNQAYSKGYLDSLLAQARLFGANVDSKKARQAVLGPAELPLPVGYPWWGTMDQARTQVRPSLLGFSYTYRDPQLRVAEDLLKNLAYVVAYERLKQAHPDVSKATYVDLLKTLQTIRNDPKTKPLFDLVYYGPKSPEEAARVVNEIVTKNPELKTSPRVRALMDALSDPRVFRYAQTPPRKAPASSQPAQDKEKAPDAEQKSNSGVNSGSNKEPPKSETSKNKSGDKSSDSEKSTSTADGKNKSAAFIRKV